MLSSLNKKFQKLTVTPSNPKPVFKSIYKQDFPFHINYINYIIEHSASTVQLKLFQTCKYFFSKTPFVPLEKLCRNGYSLEWKAINGSHQEVLNLSNIKSKLWITNSVEYASLINVKGFYEGIETAIGKYEVTSLILSNHNIKFKTFKFLISSPKLKHLDMKMMRIQDEEDGDKIVTFDRIIRELPKLDSFTLVFHIATDYTKITEALKLCDIKNLKLGNIESNFNVKAFFDYLMTQEKMQVFLCFRDLSWENRNALQEFVDQLIESGIKITPKPFLNFPGQTQKTANALEKLSSI